MKSFDSIELENQYFLYNFIIFFNQNKNTIFIYNKNKILFLYNYICLNSYVLNFSFFIKNKSIDYKSIILNNKKNQLFISFLKSTKFFKSFSTGYILTYLELLKKSLKRQNSSYILQLKVILKMIDTFFIKDVFLFNIIGTKKNFFKWLNFLKIKTQILKVLVYIYTPSVFNTPIKIKKIKSIKKRLKKKYLYQESMI